MKPQVQQPRELSRKEKQEYQRQKAIIKDTIFPILLKHSKSVKDAQNIIKSVLVGLDYKFQTRITEYETFISGENMSTLKLQEDLNDQPKNKVDYIAERLIIDALSTETIGAFRGLIQGIDKVLEAAVIGEMLDRKLETLNTKF